MHHDENKKCIKEQSVLKEYIASVCLKHCFDCIIFQSMFIVEVSGCQNIQTEEIWLRNPNYSLKHYIAYHMNSVADYYTPLSTHPTVLPEPQNHQPHQSSEQSYLKSYLIC